MNNSKRIQRSSNKISQGLGFQSFVFITPLGYIQQPTSVSQTSFSVNIAMPQAASAMKKPQVCSEFRKEGHTAGLPAKQATWENTAQGHPQGTHGGYHQLPQGLAKLCSSWSPVMNTKLGVNRAASTERSQLPSRLQSNPQINKQQIKLRIQQHFLPLPPTFPCTPQR